MIKAVKTRQAGKQPIPSIWDRTCSSGIKFRNRQLDIMYESAIGYISVLKLYAAKPATFQNMESRSADCAAV